MQSGKKTNSGIMLNFAFLILHSAFGMVAREGSAPSTSGCRPDMILLGFPSLTSQVPKLRCSLRES